MEEGGYKLMCSAHKTAKKLLGKHGSAEGLKFVDVRKDDVSEDGYVLIESALSTASESRSSSLVSVENLYPVENAVPLKSNLHLRSSFARKKPWKAVDPSYKEPFSEGLWRSFIDRSEIPNGFRNAGLKYTGYIASGRDCWCLPSWIWTSAASVRYLCAVGEIEEAVNLGRRLLYMQEHEGGWVVRSDYTHAEEIPILAPNDSAYIANNALLELYRSTGEACYLEAAIRCADWIIETARPDGLVWTGYDKKNGVWLKKHTIVDTGFTAGLFSSLSTITKDPRYETFLERFATEFVSRFYDAGRLGFATSFDSTGNKIGGRFARGQAWALEGLIPAYRVLQDRSLKTAISVCVNSLLRSQLKNGGWPYNLDRTYYGEDCKGVSVIAKSLLEWHSVEPDDELISSARRALDWCKDRTSRAGDSRGGIFSFNLEGAVVHNLYTSTAFVYSSAYALEVSTWLEKNG
jgi:rhamnogalacturonyl hydrolase YesR